jgi:succinyl-diaminopimelate desuccinylase
MYNHDVFHLDDYQPIELTQRLIQCPSITPIEGGALTALQQMLTPLGFRNRRLLYSDPRDTPDVDNLYAKLGADGAENLCFAGHTDVVPPGEISKWRHDPFAAVIEDGILYGRGAADMKTSITCFISALAKYLAEHGYALPAGKSVSLLITGDEEGVAINGTIKMLQDVGDEIDYCIVGEPTNPSEIGEMIKVGRRGSLNGYITIIGKQGHVAYPHNANNPLPILVKLLAELEDCKLDDGNDYFDSSNLEITSIDCVNPTTNLIPNVAKARFNVRFNDSYSGASLQAKLREVCQKYHNDAINVTLEGDISGESFLTDSNKMIDVLISACQQVTDLTPVLSTTGGTSDARFIKDYAKVIEFGGINATAHKIDEHVRIADIIKLRDVYYTFLSQWLAT